MTQAEEEAGRRRYAAMTRPELLDEIARLNREVRAKNDEIALLRKRLLLYKSIK